MLFQKLEIPEGSLVNLFFLGFLVLLADVVMNALPGTRPTAWSTYTWSNTYERVEGNKRKCIVELQGAPAAGLIYPGKAFITTWPEARKPKKDKVYEDGPRIRSFWKSVRARSSYRKTHVPPPASAHTGYRRY